MKLLDLYMHDGDGEKTTLIYELLCCVQCTLYISGSPFQHVMIPHAPTSVGGTEQLDQTGAIFGFSTVNTVVM